MNPHKIIGESFFSDNRRRLRELFGGKAPIVIAGNGLLQKSADHPYPFIQDSNFWYLTGIEYPGMVLVMEFDHEYIIMPPADASRDTFEGTVDTDELTKASGIETFYEHDEGWKQLSRRLRKVKHVATTQPAPSYIKQLVMYTSPARARLVRQLKKHNEHLNLIDLRSVLASMRSVKNETEIELIKTAFDETKRLYRLLEKKRQKAEYESELMAELQREIIRRGVEFAYDPIIASGKNAITLHYTQNNKPINRAQFLLVDAAVKVGNYNADITRSIVDRPTKRQRQIYEAVLAVQDFAISLLKPGANLKTYEEAVFQFMGEKLRELGLIKTITKESVQEYYPHATSHFLGIDVHDVGDREQALVPGMLLTVEPGIYIKEEGIGIRLEDMLLITDKGNENLSAGLPKIIDRFV